VTKPRTRIRSRADHYFLVSTLNENVGNTFAETFALGNRKQMILALGLCAGNQCLVVEGIRAAQQRPRYLD
jgi:hypothetical protein